MLNLFSRLKLRKYQVNAEGGMIYVDLKVQKWLDSFKYGDENQKTDIEKEIFKRITKSGYEEKKVFQQPDELPTISLILVTYNSEMWLENLQEMFSNLSPWLHEIIVVDNNSIDDSMEGIRKLGNSIKIIENEQTVTFATAVNQGCKLAAGEILLIINPDVYIPKSSLWSLINFYQQNSDAAAIVPKLMLMKTPGFINGIGNIVPQFRWGYDLGLGHLDVGQFDHITEVPSACFATVLIPRKKWNEVGELDEEYPMYYEDSDWSYRARGMGYRILTDTNSLIFHAFGGNHENKKVVSGKKILEVTYGRLRLILKIFLKINLATHLISYILFDFAFVIYSFLIINMENIKMVTKGWKLFFGRLNEILNLRKISHYDLHIKNQLNNKYFVDVGKPRVHFGNPIITHRILNFYKSNFLDQNY